MYGEMGVCECGNASLPWLYARDGCENAFVAPPKGRRGGWCRDMENLPLPVCWSQPGGEGRVYVWERLPPVAVRQVCVCIYI